MGRNILRKLTTLGWVVTLSILIVAVACRDKQVESGGDDSKHVLIYEADAGANADQMEGELEIVTRRVNLSGIEKAAIWLHNENFVAAEIPGDEDAGRIDVAKSLIQQTARLVFIERTCTDPSCHDFDDVDIGLSGNDLATVSADQISSAAAWGVAIQFTDRGIKIFSDLTRRISTSDEKRIAVFLDDGLVLAPVARA